MKRNAFTKIIALLTGCLAALAVICTTVAADVIWEPDDDFYRREAENCVHLGRSYTANGGGGSVDVLKSPGSGEKVATVENGNTFFIAFTYTDKDDEKWGVIELSDKGGTGWIRMDELLVVYDYISFEEEHKNEFRQWKGGYDGLEAGNDVVFWSYPGSGVITRKDSEIDKDLSISYVYTDADGRDWGFVGYYYAVRNCWVCISDPANDAIPAFNAQSDISTPSPGAVSSETTVRAEQQEPQAAGGPSAEVLLFVLVAMVVICTLILLKMFWKKK